MHGCGVLDPDEPFSVKRFLDLCDGWRRRIVERGRRPLYVGGTGLYLRALRWGLFEEPPIDPRLRDRLNDELQREGAVAMHERLARLDPALALKVPAADGVRIVRALEIAEGSGRPLSELQTQWLDPRPRFDRELLVLTCPRERLVERIERRIDAMFAAGWVAEVGRLLEAGRSPELHCFKALGYREIVALLRGEVDEATTRKRIEARTRQFAKRQMTWLRAERDARWIEYDGRSPESALPEIEKLLDARRSLS
jgi:tRNA dimethylallyltransferase